MNDSILATKQQDTEEHWISISDMMAGLMVIFLFIAISYMLDVSADKDAIDKIVVTYEQLRADLYADLYDEFKDDLTKWNVVLDEDMLSMRFKEPEVLFARGSAEVRPLFRKILNEFFPRYIKILSETKTNDGEYKYKDDIAEIRIEGHTSSEWEGVRDIEEVAYILNMELSQDRTRHVLNYVLQIKNPRIQQNRKWIRDNLTANGLSSSKLIRNLDGTQNPQESRRVEFRVRTNAEKRIVEIPEKEKMKMGLPDFLQNKEFNDLRQQMGADLVSWDSGGSDWKRFEIEIPLISVKTNGRTKTLEFNGSTVIVYIRDQYIGDQEVIETLRPRRFA